MALLKFERLYGLTRGWQAAGLCCLIVLGFVDPVWADAKKSCGGSSILDEIQAGDPDLFAGIIKQVQGTQNDGALLWRISRDGIPDSFLFGTLHMTDPRVTKLSKQVRAAIEDSKVVALEVADTAPAVVAAALANAPALMMFDDGRRLDHLVSPEHFSKVKELLDVARLPSGFARSFKPWVVSMVMAVSECERKRMEGGKPVLDTRIAEVAQAKGIPVVGLETVESQLEAAASVPMEEQVAMLRLSLQLADRSDDLRETILQLYLAKQLGALLPLQRILAERHGIKDTEFAGFKSRMVDRRNRKMRTRSLPLLSKGKVFVAVGALHLIGEDGLVTLLRNAGYTLEPVE